MDTKEPKDKQRRKRRRPRVRLDWLKAEWSPAAGFTLTGAGLIGVAVVVVVWLTTGHQARAKVPNPSGLPATTSSVPSNNPHPPVTTVSTVTITPAATTGGKPTSRISSTTTRSTPTTTHQTTSQVTEVPGPGPIQLGRGWVKADPDHQDCGSGYQFNFFQEITVIQPGDIELEYTWERSDGTPQDKRSVLKLSGPGTKAVTDSWRRWGDPGTELFGDEWIHIFRPVDLVAKKDKNQRIHFSYECPIPPG
jgi:hypothetical protein